MGEEVEIFTGRTNLGILIRHTPEVRFDEPAKLRDKLLSSTEPITPDLHETEMPLELDLEQSDSILIGRVVLTTFTLLLDGRNKRDTIK